MLNKTHIKRVQTAAQKNVKVRSQLQGYYIKSDKDQTTQKINYYDKFDIYASASYSPNRTMKE